MAYSARYNSGGDDYGGGGGFMQGSQNNNTPGGTRRPEQLLRPVTIKQLLDAEASHTDSALMIQDIDLVNVSFCALVRSMTRNPTNVLMQVEDGTGMIEVRKWTDSSDGETEGLDIETGVQEHDWVRVIGTPKVFNNKKHVSGLRLQKIEDFNQINYHLLDVVRVTLFYERGPGGGDGMNVDKPVTTTTHGRLVQPHHDRRTPKQAKIMDVFGSVQLPEEGMHVNEIAGKCGLRLDEVAEEIAKLIADGELYQTVDEDHYMATGA